MMAFIEQEAKEKVEEIDAKVNEKEMIMCPLLCFSMESRIIECNWYNDVISQSGDLHLPKGRMIQGVGVPVSCLESRK